MEVTQAELSITMEVIQAELSIMMEDTQVSSQEDSDIYMYLHTTTIYTTYIFTTLLSTVNSFH